MGGLDCRKTPSGFSDKSLQPAARRFCFPVENKTHTCRLRGIFGQVHAPAEDDSDSLCHESGKLCEALL